MLVQDITLTQRQNAVEDLVDKFAKEGTPIEVKKKVRDAILYILDANIRYQAEVFYLDFKEPLQPKK